MMNREQMIRNIKREMKRWIDQMDDTNYREIEGSLSKYYGLMDTIVDLPAPPPVPVKKKKEPLHEKSSSETINTDNRNEEKEEIIETNKEEQEINNREEALIQEQEEASQKGYVFERKLRGGVLPDIDAFVPEGLIRKLGLEHGDLVDAEKIPGDTQGRNKYRYKLLESMHAEDTSGRKQLNYCLIEKEAGYLVVKKSYTTGEEIEYDGVSFSTVLNDGDIQHFSLKEGDIIDIAYKETNPSENKVVWVHQDELPEPNEEKPSKLYKSSNGVDTGKEVSEEIEPTLLGKDILIIGNPGNPVQYQEAIEKRGGKSVLVDSNERAERLAPLIRKSSFVILLLASSGHTGMKRMKQLCKDYDIPFEATFHQGISSVIRTAEEMVEKHREERKKESV